MFLSLMFVFSDQLQVDLSLQSDLYQIPNEMTDTSNYRVRNYLWQL